MCCDLSILAKSVQDFAGSAVSKYVSTTLNDKCNLFLTLIGGRQLEPIIRPEIADRNWLPDRVEISLDRLQLQTVCPLDADMSVFTFDIQAQISSRILLVANIRAYPVFQTFVSYTEL